MTTEQIQKRIAALSADEAIGTNDGTHGLDPQWHTWTTYQRLDGTTYTQGKVSDAGYERHLTHESPQSRRSQIEALKAELVAAAAPQDWNSRMARR